MTCRPNSTCRATFHRLRDRRTSGFALLAGRTRWRTTTAGREDLELAGEARQLAGVLSPVGVRDPRPAQSDWPTARLSRKRQRERSARARVQDASFASPLKAASHSKANYEECVLSGRRVLQRGRG